MKSLKINKDIKITKKTICFIIPSLKSGGMERVAVNLANYFCDNYSNNIAVILLSNKEIFYSLNKNIKLIIPTKNICFKNILIRYLWLYLFLRRYLKKLKATHVIGFGETYNAFIIFATLFLNINVYVSNRASPLSSLKGFRGLINPLFYPLAKGVLIQTQTGIDILKRKYKFTKFIKIENPFIISENINKTAKRKKTILNVGYLGGNKNQDLLISYFNEVSKDNEWKLIFYGDGPKRNELQRKIKYLNREQNILLLGKSKDIINIMQKSQIFAFTSTSEGFPNVLGEAMAAGCACISYNCVTGPSELIDDGINGFLVPVGDHEQYKNKLKILMNNDQLRNVFGKAARYKIKNNFNTEIIAQKYLELLNN